MNYTRGDIVRVPSSLGVKLAIVIEPGRKPGTMRVCTWRDASMRWTKPQACDVRLIRTAIGDNAAKNERARRCVARIYVTLKVCNGMVRYSDGAESILSMNVTGVK